MDDMQAIRSEKLQPTQRQKEYLNFLISYTEKYRLPSSFEDIARHFMTSGPSVNGMIKTLEKRRYITKIPGQPRTLRVLIPKEQLGLQERIPATTIRRTSEPAIKAVIELACLVIERLVSALGKRNEYLHTTFDAVDEALANQLHSLGASKEQQLQARQTLLKVAHSSLGMNYGRIRVKKVEFSLGGMR